MHPEKPSHGNTAPEPANGRDVANSMPSPEGTPAIRRIFLAIDSNPNRAMVISSFASLFITLSLAIVAFFSWREAAELREIQSQQFISAYRPAVYILSPELEIKNDYLFFRWSLHNTGSPVYDVAYVSILICVKYKKFFHVKKISSTLPKDITDTIETSTKNEEIIACVRSAREGPLGSLAAVLHSDFEIPREFANEENTRREFRTDVFEWHPVQKKFVLADASSRKSYITYAQEENLLSDGERGR